MLEALARVLPLAVALGAVILGAGMFRLTAINTFIDHRKTALRNQLRTKIDLAPYLIVIIQRIGKVPQLAKEERLLLAVIHEAYAEIVGEIQSLRLRAFRWTEGLRAGLFLWICFSVALFLLQAPLEVRAQAISATAVVLVGALSAIVIVGRALQPSADRLESHEDGLRMIEATRAILLASESPPKRVAPEPSPHEGSAVSLGDVWQAQEGMLQSYRFFFGIVETLLLAGALFSMSSAGAAAFVVACALGGLLAVVWSAVCRARARAVVFVHWLIRRTERGEHVHRPYSLFREFQETGTVAGLNIHEDATFSLLRRTLTGRRMDLEVPVLFLLTWIA